MQKEGLICRSKVKKYALELARMRYKHTPVYTPTRVSKEFLDLMETSLMEKINFYVSNRASVGKTI